ncbi:MAG: PQQ-dependent sugar dehydrogenase [Myxococcales bacterium]|nr:PQQ-dependent sugar dehydrogenase [Myxococcales bacterium]
MKSGLDAPPVPVGPFLDGVLPTRTPSDLTSATWEIIEAFPNLTFNQTLVIVTNPANNRLYIGSRDGNIFSFENTPSVASSEPFVDLRDRVAVVWDGGFLGLAFHPDFGTPGSPYETTFYVYYSSFCPTTLSAGSYVNDFNNCNPGYPTGSTGGFFNTWLRLSRFEAFWDAGLGTWRGDPDSEVPLFNIRLYNGSHRGGGPVFGQDGYMYVAIGDQFRYETAQDIAANFEGGSIRIDVDIVDNGDGTWSCASGSHQPIRKMQDVTGNPDEMTGHQYCIPDDNPWPGLSGENFGEYNTIGHRNPHRIAVDPVTGRMWSGEIGQSTREEVNVLLTGHNYQWPYMEGLTTGVRPRPPTVIGIEQPPVIDFVRSEARAIIGGYVYRGTKFPGLYGKYLAGDYVLDNIWAITLDEQTMTATKDFLTTFTPGGLGTWGQDNNGEVYLGDVFGTDALYTLDEIAQSVPEPPALLSDVGAFQDLVSLDPSPFWVPYQLNQPFWSDGAAKFRWIALPNDGARDTAGEQIGYSETGIWSYPTGTVLMKHFELPLDENDPSLTARLETRFLVLGDDDKWYGVTYRWRLDHTDAELLTTSATRDYSIALAGGGTRDQTWYFPARQQCLACHLQVSGGALGLNTRQQNGDMFYPSTGRTDNQLVTWNHLEMFSPALDEATIPTLLRSVEFTDVSASLEDRARSWLDSNCGYCHRPGGANAGFDARLTTPFENQGMVYGAVRDDLGFPGMTVLTPGDPTLSALYQRAGAVGPIGMPPLAKALAQTPAVDILGEWILRVDPAFPSNDPPTLTNPGPLQSEVGESVSPSLQATDPNGDLLYYDAAGLPPGLTLDHTSGQITGTLTAAALGTHDVTASASDQNEVSVVSYTWTVSPPAGGCGDGSQDPGEECDDGNLTDGDGCTSSCVLEFCGDGIVNNGGLETCEPPNTALCSSTCTIIPGGMSCTSDLDCDDGNVCTDDQCDPGTSTCLHDNIAVACEDQNACTSIDVCAEGVCVGGDLAGGCTSCEGLADLPPEGGVFFGSIAGSSFLTGSCGSTGNTPERVYRWVPEVSGLVTIETCGPETDYDTALYVRSDSCETGSEIDCNDDTTGCGVNDGLSNAARHGSRIQLVAEQGRPYFIVVSGYNGRIGNYKLTVSTTTASCGNGVQDAGEECDGADAGNCASGQCQGTGDANPCSCVSPSSAPDLVSAVLELGIEFDTTVPSEDVAEGCASATSGIDILRFRTDTINQGNADMVLGAPSCPNCSSSPGASCGNPNFVCSPPGGHGHPHYDNFARFDLVDTVTRAVVATTHKRGFCLRDSFCTTGSAFYDCGFQGISAGCGDKYSRFLGCQFVEITGVPTGQYELQVTVDPFNLFPELDENNNVSVAPVTITRAVEQPISPLGGVFAGFTSGSSAHSGSCASSGTGSSPEQVFTLTPTTSGTYTVQTCSPNTNYDTVVYVREGALGGAQIGCNDDTTGCAVNSGSSGASRHGSVVSFDVTAGQTYYIVVDGYNAEGAFELTVTRPDGGFCGNGTADGPEACDGADDGACPGLCQQDCSCDSQPSVCGDGVMGGSEACDGADDAACPGLCQTDCTCAPPPVCGDGTQEGGEACDGSDDAACPGLCLPDCACAPPTATSNTLVPVKDNTLFESALGDLSNGAGDYLFAGRTGAAKLRRALMAFDVAGGVPAGSIIHAAKLTLNMSRTVAGPSDVSLHRMTADWGEGTSDAPGEEGGGAPATDGDVTWLYTQYDLITPASSPAWSTPGGDFEAGASAATSVALEGYYSWFSPGLTADVQAWLDDPAGNFGWIMVGDEQNQPTAKRFDSRENGVSANWPELVVYFSPPSSNWGACCAVDGSCGFALDAVDCASQGGEYQGDATICSPNPCPLPPDICGNGILGPGEECEVGEDDACPGLCQGDCTCAPPPACGNGVHETGEECDAPDVSGCPTGQCYGPGSSEGPECTCVPPATDIPAGGGIVSGFTSGASNDSGSCGSGSVNAPEQGFVWVPDFTGAVTLETCSPNTEFDTVLYVREGGSTGSEVACNDDTSGCGVSSGSGNSGRHGSRVTINVVAGQTYYVVVDGYRPSSGADEGAFELAVTPAGGGPGPLPPIAQPDSRTTDQDTPITIDVLSNDSDPDGVLVPSSVAVIVSASNGVTSVNPADGMITYTPNALFEGLDQFTYEVFDADGLSDTAVVTVNVTSTPSSATPIPPTGGVISGFTSGSSIYSGTCAGASARAPEQVFEWVPDVSGTATVETCSLNTEFDTVLYVRDGDIAGPELGCSDDVAGCAVNSGSSNSGRHGSRVVFDVVAGQTYFIFADAYSPSSGATEGNFELTVIPAGP